MKAPVFYKKLLWIFFICSFHVLSAQVGIGTKSPRKTLEVAGDMIISDAIDIGTYNPLVDGNISSFVVQEPDNTIKSLDVSNPTGVALAYIQEYRIVNPNLDWIHDFDTGIDANDFVVIATSASFTEELDLTDNSGADLNSSLPFTATFIENGTWHIVSDYPQAANLDETAIGTWIIKTLIFSTDVAKQFGVIDIGMSNASSGSAAAPIID